MANSLRRIMLAEVPILCIDIVNIENNTTSMQDEYIAHRLGLIPLRSTRPMSEWSYNHDCDCDSSCNMCSVTFTLGNIIIIFNTNSNTNNNTNTNTNYRCRL
jgi:DNA-directed RNA polymerase II subunit RPB3